jgi:hypothetical protein
LLSYSAFIKLCVIRSDITYNDVLIIKQNQNANVDK